MILADLHTHTTYSHGKGSILQNTAAAAAKGLKQIAISDHGYRHMLFAAKFRDLPRMKREAQEAMDRFPDVQVLIGVEANIYSSDGKVDVSPSQREALDLVIGGFHKMVFPAGFLDFFRFFTAAQWGDWFGFGASAKKIFTQSIVCALRSGILDVLTHPNYGILCDAAEVARAAADYGVLIEINGRHNSLSDEDLCKMASLGARFIINSDAHRPEDVGNFSVALAQAERVGLCPAQIANWQKLPLPAKEKGR